MRSAVTQRHAESLCAPHGNVCSELAWRLEQNQAQQIRRDCYQRACFMSFRVECGVVLDFAPNVSGYWTSAPNTRWSNVKFAMRPTATSIPSAAARVFTTSIVCGWEVSAT